MSTAKSNKKKQQPAFATTGKSAPAAITLGMTLLTLGLAVLLSKLMVGDGYFLRQMSLFSDGLAGKMWPGIPLMLCWGGAKLLVSARHRVSARDYFLVLCIYLLALGGYTLIARVRLDGSSAAYMDYLSRMRDERDPYANNTFYVYMRNAYRLGRNGAGGWLGMLIAYPVWKVARSVLGAVLVGILLIVLLLMLFRVNPVHMMRKSSAKNEKQTSAKQPAKPAAVPASNDTETSPASPTVETSRPEMIYPLSAYQQTADSTPSFADKNKFYSAQPNLYEEYFDTRTAKDARSANAPQDSARGKAKAQRLFENCGTADENGGGRPETKRILRNQKPASARNSEDNYSIVSDDDLPWDDDIPSSVRTRKNDPLWNGGTADDDEKPADKPEQSSWAEQVRIKQSEAEREKPAQPKRSISGAAKPVYTDPVMPITRERIAISPRDTDKKADEKMDGTLAPKKEQSRMRLNVAYQAPPLRLLNTPKPIRIDDMVQEDQHRAEVIVNTLKSFKIDATVRKITHGPSVTQFAIEIGQGIKVNRVTGLANNLALDMKVANVRMEQVQHTNLIGIEVPNMKVAPVTLLEVLDSPEMRNSANPLLVALGKDIEGKPILCDLSAMPHLLIAGATGSGKSVCINSIICSLLYRTSPEQVKLIMVDPKQVELAVYNDIPHLLLPVISDARKVSGALEWAVQEMEERYSKFQALKIRSLARYNNVYQGTDKVMPNIVIIIDEMADLMQVCGKEIEASIQRLSAKARAAGIYLVVATQRPSVKVITGDIKNNIPSRIAFAVASGTDSSTILDSYGAEKLIGRGDMLYKPQGTSPIRVQGCFTTDDEVIHITDYIKDHNEPEYDPDIGETIEQMEKEKKGKLKPDEIGGGGDDGNGGDDSYDHLLAEAIELAVDSGQISTSMLQRRLSIGYARAGRMVDEMEKRGIVSQAEGSKPRKTLMTREEYYDNLADVGDE